MMEVEIAGDGAQLARFARAGEALRTSEGILLHKVGKIVSAAIAQEFLTGGHGEWAPVQAETLRLRRRNRGPEPLLDELLLFRAAIATQNGVSGSLYSLTVEGLTMGVEPGFRGALHHQMGFTGPNALGRMYSEPARPFVRLRAEELPAISAPVVEFAEALMGML